MGSPVPVEAMEYGWATWLPHRSGPHPPVGAFGGAWTAASSLWMLARGASDIYQWGIFDRSFGFVNHTYLNATREHVSRPLLSANDWLRSMLEFIKGGVSTTSGQPSDFVVLARLLASWTKMRRPCPLIHA